MPGKIRIHIPGAASAVRKNDDGKCPRRIRKRDAQHKLLFESRVCERYGTRNDRAMRAGLKFESRIRTLTAGRNQQRAQY